MRESFTKIFVNHPQLLSEMLMLRLQGWPIRTLAALYRVDKSSIKHWCHEFNIESLDIAPETIPAEELKRPIGDNAAPRPNRVSLKFTYVTRDYPSDPGERINPGKTYAEYLREAGYKKRYVQN